MVSLNERAALRPVARLRPGASRRRFWPEKASRFGADYLDPNSSSLAFGLRLTGHLGVSSGRRYFYFCPLHSSMLRGKKRPFLLFENPPILSGRRPRKSSHKAKRGAKREDLPCGEPPQSPRRAYGFTSPFRWISKRAPPTEIFS